MFPFNPKPATFSNGMQPESTAAISYSGQDRLPWVQTGPDRSLLLLIEQTFFLPALQSHPQSPARLWLQGWGHSEREFHFPYFQNRNHPKFPHLHQVLLLLRPKGSRSDPPYSRRGSVSEAFLKIRFYKKIGTSHPAPSSNVSWKVSRNRENQPFLSCLLRQKRFFCNPLF